MKVFLLATLDTKKDLIDFLIDELKFLKVESEPEIIDMSIQSDQILSGEEKLQALHQSTRNAREQLKYSLKKSFGVAVGLAGGTGAQMISSVFSELPLRIPKMLISPFPNDPRNFIADNNIILIPSVCDLLDLNFFVKQVLKQTALMIKGLVKNGEQFQEEYPEEKVIGITSLGTTNAGVEMTCEKLAHSKFSTTVFHSNGFGGKALSRWSSLNILRGIIDFTIHELTMLLYEKNHLIPSDRFICATESRIPLVILPGGVNFFTRMNMDEEDKKYVLSYPHSPMITHVALTEAEMYYCGKKLGIMFKNITSPVTLLMPMEGFSSEDRAGGMIENKKGRSAFLEGFVSEASSSAKTVCHDFHINDSECAEQAVKEFLNLL